MKFQPSRNPALVALVGLFSAGLLWQASINAAPDRRAPTLARAEAQLDLPSVGSPATFGLAGEQNQETVSVHLPYVSASSILSPPPKLVRRGHLGPNSRAIAAGPYFVYASNGPSVIVLESGPDGWRQVGRSELIDGLIFDLQLVEERLYAAAGEAGLVVFDISTPTAPVVLGQAATDDLAVAVDVSGQEAMVAASDAGLQVFDLGEEVPARSAAVPIEGGAMAIHRRGNVAYVSTLTWDPPTIVDLSDPLRPRNVGLLGELGETWMPAMFSMDDYLYAFDCGNCLAIFDIEDPLEPLEIEHDTWLNVVVDVAMADPAGRRAVLWGEGLISELDLADPEKPLASEPQWIGRLVWDMERVEDRLLVAHTSGVPEGGSPWTSELGPGGVLEIDAEDCCRPVRFYTPTLASSTIIPQMAAGRATYAYVNTSSWSRQPSEPAAFVIDFSDPIEPRLGARVEAPLHSGLQMVGDHGLQIEAEGDEARIAVYDLSEPARPRRLGAQAAPPAPDGRYFGRSLQVLDDGHALYSTMVYGGGVATTTLGIFDISAAPDIVSIDDRTLPGVFRGAALGGQRLFVAMIEGQDLVLRTLDLAAPAGDRELGAFAFPEAGTLATFRSLVMLDDSALLAAMTSGVFVIDVEDPLAPRLHGPVSERSLGHLARLDRWHVLGIGDGTLIFDVRDPLRPKVVSTLDPSANYARGLEATQVAWRDGFLYVGLDDTGKNGLSIVEVQR